MLIGGPNTGVRGRILLVLGASVGSLAAGLLVAFGGSLVKAWEWPPKASGPLGVSLGVLAALVVFFEMLIWPRKWFRGRRLGATKVWLWWHVWVGFASLPVVVVHTGFGFGGPLPATTLVLFLLVYASGVWGLILQQWLPQKLLTDMPAEGVAVQTGRLSELLAVEAERLSGLTDAPSPELQSFVRRRLVPYLRGEPAGVALRGVGSAGQEFGRLRQTLPLPLHPTLDRLRELADTRRKYDLQRWWNGWLHGWLLVHLPLSVAMTGLMVLHAVRALKYW